MAAERRAQSAWILGSLALVSGSSARLCRTRFKVDGTASRI